MKCKPWIRHFQPPKFQCFRSQCGLHGLRPLETLYDTSLRAWILKKAISLEMFSLARKLQSRLTFSFLTFRNSPKEGLGGWLAWNLHSHVTISIPKGDLALFLIVEPLGFRTFCGTLRRSETCYDNFCCFLQVIKRHKNNLMSYFKVL